MSRQKIIYWLAGRKQRKTAYPSGTTAYCGPAAERAGKAAGGVLKDKRGKRSDLSKKCFSDHGDLGDDFEVMAEIVEFLPENKIERVAVLDRIIGCPPLP